MRLKLTPEFHRQRQRYALRFSCEHCSYFDCRGQRCVHGWPVEEHRLEHYERVDCSEIVFCKEFELL